MKGRVTKYFEEKGYGFVKDENEESRFFHISDVNTISEIGTGSLVEFSPDQNNKGLICLNIEVLTKKKAAFISVGNTNIKVSNIKQFGVNNSSKVKAIKAPIYEKNPEYFFKKISAGKNLFKHLFLPKEFIFSNIYADVPRSEFQVIRNNDNPSSHKEYKLPYILVRITPTSNEKNYSSHTVIHEDKAKYIFWKYLYISTYQNDNYQFYEYEIDIDKTLSELNRLVNN